ncbi:MAG TPA: MmgE/PrpD family protein [Thermodesulfobacteriota bacterium]|nr:MmgE/PrpD family protein [Thermodesulfobacteriota bacterium]
MTTSQRLADFIGKTTYDTLPPDVHEMAKLCFLDWLGAAIAGTGALPTDIIVDLVGEMGGKEEATLIPTGGRSSSLWAALVNGAASHVVEMDDVHRTGLVHPGVAVIPAALALAEREGSSGRDLLTAIALGYEVAIRVGQALGPSHYERWHTTGTAGTFGAAVACGKLLALDQEQLVWTLGSAGSQAAGVWEFLADGAMSKQLHAGKAAMNGALAALLAQRGFTGAERILEGEKGFLKATSREPRLDRLTEGLGDRWEMLGTSFKAHAACRHIHSAIDATLQALRGRQLPPREVERMTVRLYGAALDLCERVEATSPYAAKFNIPFCVATAVRYGRVGPEAFTEERLEERDIKELVRRVVLKRDDELDDLFPAKWPAVVELVTRDGRREEVRVEYPKGDPENPMSREDLAAKFRDLTRKLLPAAKVERFIQIALRLDELENANLLFA